MAALDFERDYRMALEVTVQWLQQYQLTRNPRAREAALACAQIARERFETLQRHREAAARLFQPLVVFLPPSAELTDLLSEARASIAECQAVLEHWPEVETTVTDVGC